MKKALSIILCMLMVFALCACGKESGEWKDEGYYADEAGNMLSITYMEDVDDPGWYVGFMNGEDFIDDSYGGTLKVKNGTLQGKLVCLSTGKELTVTVSKEGEDGMLVKVKGGDEYHLAPMEIPEARFTVSLETEGFGGVAYAAGTETPEYDPQEPYQSAYFGVYDDNTTYTILAYEYLDEYHFVKWTKNGEDYTTEPQFTVDIDADVEFVAVFK